MAKEKNQLKRSLGLFDILMFGIGGIVGAGIYAIIGEVAGLAGNMLWASFCIAAVVAWLTGLAYAEFVSQFPDAGGSFEYIKQGFNQKFALGMSVIMLLTSIIAPAAIAISFSDYLSRLWETPNWITTIGIIALMGFINMISVKLSSWYNTGATIITLLGLGVVIVFAIPYWGEADLMELPKDGMTGLFSGGALIFFSYVGFEDLVKLAEEAKNPEKDLPKGILISGFVVLIIYVLIAISAINVMGAEGLANSSGPLAAVMDKMAGKNWTTVLIVVALFATSKTVLSNVLGASRLVFDVARDSGFSWLKKLAKVDEGSGTPKLAIVAVSIAVILFGLIGNLKIVASLSNIFIFTLFIVVNFALINYRKNHEKANDAPFRIPLNVNNVPIPTVIALLGLFVLLGFNVYNLI